MTSPRCETQGPCSAGEDWMSWLHLHDLEDNQPQRPDDLDSVLNSTAGSLDVDHSSVDEVFPSQDHSQQVASWKRRPVNASVLRNDGRDSVGQGFRGLPSGLSQTSDSSFIDDDLGLPQAAFNADYGVPSDSSVGSLDSFTSSGLIAVRRRRRQAVRSNIDMSGQKAIATRTAGRRYQCTFCTDTFKTKHDWQRHETSMHLSLEQWK